MSSKKTARNAVKSAGPFGRTVRGPALLLVSIGLLIALSVPAGAEDAATSFKGFCEDWMQKLVDRERANVGHIKWEKNGDRIQGTYVGYTQEHSCQVKTGTASVPVGKITYQEIRYEQRGGTVEEAQASPARAVETTEVTEIFSYSGGKWMY